MRGAAGLVVAAVLGWFFLGSPQVMAQQLSDAPAMESMPAVAGDKLMLGKVEAELKTLKADSEIETGLKEKLLIQLQQAADLLKQADEHEAKGAVFRKAVNYGPAEAEQLQARVEDLPAAGTAPTVAVKGGAEEVQEELDRQRAVLLAKKTEFKTGTDELVRVKGRPLVISASLPEADRKLSELQAQLESPGLPAQSASPEERVDRLLLLAEERQVRSELQMLKLEQLGQSAREVVLQARLDLLAREVEIAAAVVESLGAMSRMSLEQEVRELASQARAIGEEVGQGDEVSEALVAEVVALAGEYESAVGQLNEANRKWDSITDRLGSLVQSYDLLKEKLKVSGGGVVMAQSLFKLERNLPSRPALRVDLRQEEEKLDAAYLSLINVHERLKQQAELRKRFDAGEADSLLRLIEVRGDLLENLRSQYGRLIRRLAEMLGSGRSYVHKIGEVRSFVSKELFWMRSVPPLGIKEVAATPAGLKWIFSAAHGRELRDALVGEFRRHPLLSGLYLLVMVVLLLRRRVNIRRIKATGVETRRMATDHYALTLQALFYSVLLLLPVPMLIAYSAWAVGQAPEPSSWLQGLAYGLRVVTWIALLLSFVAAVCHKGGLGSAHFRWPERPLAQLRKAIQWVALLYVPAFLLLSSCLYGEAADYFGSAGRVCFIVAHVWTAFIYWKLLRFPRDPAKGKAAPASFARWQRVNFAFGVIAPAILVLLAVLGFQFTALELNQIVLGTVAVAVGGVLVYWMALRWLMIRVRRLALEDALRRRRERLEALAQEREGEVEEDSSPEDEVEELDVAAIGEQTRHLLRILCMTGTLLVIGVLWSEIFPVFTILNSVTLIGNLTVLELALAVLIVVITTVATRNLPGLIELVMLRTSHMTSGSRKALTSLCQYVLIATGAALVFHVLDLGWSRFGWIATALSVGLGFGLQEVVANFVCGIILLFEQPIRVGDFVTVEGMVGRVTRIRMRATTIVNFDRQEFVVPNKNFITGTLLNWTLKDSTVRIVVPVGVAYSTDTDRALEILLELAARHPDVLDDPKPEATFEEFADSSLTLRLKVHVPIERMIQVLSELHSSIKKGFESEGVVIAFPQRDLHIRTSGVIGEAE